MVSQRWLKLLGTSVLIIANDSQRVPGKECQRNPQGTNPNTSIITKYVIFTFLLNWYFVFPFIFHPSAVTKAILEIGCAKTKDKKLATEWVM